MPKQSERCFSCVPTVPLDWLEAPIPQQNVEMDAKYCNIEERLQMSVFFLQWIKKRRKSLKGHCNEAGICLSV